jgi:predicted nucleic acid-binding protein
MVSIGPHRTLKWNADPHTWIRFAANSISTRSLNPSHACFGRIEGEQASRGISIGFEDLAIGAMALAFGFSVVTYNIKHFELIPGLNIHVL